MTPAPQRRYSRHAGTACALLATACGSIVLFGWSTDRPSVTDWFDTGICMLPNTAFAIVLLGLALLLRTAEQRRAGLVCAMLAAAIGTATIAEYLFRIDLGIDRLLLTANWGQQATISPGRMGPPAALMFVVLGVSITLATSRRTWRRRWRRYAATGGLVCIGIASLSLIGSLYGARYLYVIPALTAIALPTALMVLLLSTALLIALPDMEPMRTLVAKSATGTLVRRALPVLVLVPVVIGALRWWGQEAGLYDAPFGTALRTIAELICLLTLLWWMAAAVARYEQRNNTNEAALRTSEQRYHSFIRLSSEGIWRCEIEQPMRISLPPAAAIDWIYSYGYVAEANDAMARMYGYTQGDQLTGVRLRDLVPRSPENDAYLRAFITGGFHLRDGESQEHDAQGHTLHFSNNLVGVVEDGFLVRAWGTQRDITEQKRAEHELRTAKDELERMDRRKDEFLATLSHELRNPLAPLTTGMDLLTTEATGLPEDTRQVHAMMRRQLDQLVHLIDDLMDVNRINRGRIGLRTAPLDLTTAVHTAVEAARPLVHERGHHLELDLPTTPLPLEGDAVRLAQVVLNLLNNAAKYTPPGGRIRLSAHRHNGHVLLEVQDNGIGLQPDQLTTIFDLFAQVQPHDSTHYRDGLGIGLSLVKRLVELHGGTVEAHSEGLGQGATFRVRVPVP